MTLIGRSAISFSNLRVGPCLGLRLFVSLISLRRFWSSVKMSFKILECVLEKSRKLNAKGFDFCVVFIVKARVSKCGNDLIEIFDA